MSLGDRLKRALGLEAKASQTAKLVAWATGGQAVWTPRDYASLAREGFTKNPIVYRSVRMIAEAAGSVPLYLFDGGKEVDEHPLLTLLKQPNPMECGPDLLESFFGHLIVAGNAYLEAVAVDGTLRELHALRPDRMKVVPGSDGWPESYEYAVAGRTMRFDQDGARVRPILHMALFHPLNDHYGLSPLEPAAVGLDLHNAAGDWNKALLDNSACPSGALVYTAKDGQLTPEQYERLKTELEDGFAGAANAGRPLLLEGGLDWKAMGLSPRDMDFISAKHVAAREVALALGVPPMLLCIPGDNTYANYAEANRSFWRQTVLPLVTRTAKALSAWLAPGFGLGARPDTPALELKPDLDAVEALSTEREALWARVQASDFLTVNEKRAAVGYGAIEGGDTLSGAPPP
ncbi:MAG: phage portal protein [Methyloceanibacter sp.]|nr:phage portal protein [Methyloceanibacter sp.]